MKRLLALVSVTVVGLVAGALITGRPQSVPRDLVVDEIPSSSATTSTTMPATTSPLTSTTTPQTRTTTTTPTSTIPITSTMPPTSASTATSTTTRPPTTAAPTTSLLPQSDISVLVANASDTFMLASRTRQGLLDLGYAFVSSTIGLSPSPVSRIYYAPAREGEAQRLAREISAPRELIAARPDEPVVRADIDYDVLIFLGDDWDEVTDLELIVPEQVAPPDSIN